MSGARGAPSQARTITLPGAGLNLAADRWAPPADRTPKGVVVLLHGGGQTRHSWRRTGERLAADGWIAYAVDLRGHGDSDWAADGDYGMTVMIADLRETIARIKAVEPAVPVSLVGASLGGKVALIAIGEDPTLADSLVLVDIAVSVERSGARRVKEFMRGAPEGFGSLEEAAAAISGYNPHRRHGGSLEGLRKNLRLRGGRWHWHWDPAMMRLDRPDDEHADSAMSAAIYARSRAAALALRHPVLLVRGAHSDVVSDAGVAEMRELIPQATVLDVRGVGHMVAGDDNDIFTANLLGYLDGTLEHDHHDHHDQEVR
ncbi:alpha/beta fold hydrolase [Nocardioides sp. BP30]|uniref:alpha/beta fold hydrolase n=1 Tax=Nocardioides sp. BP30 TaxID=3036374 RepID=UPI002469474D|nr:alpha/beta fold hydrolase [Nocardioides sp. BP30]WGL54083.1 alpha/beta fold hydrolase [Nocardioides sp. BP30]